MDKLIFSKFKEIATIDQKINMLQNTIISEEDRIKSLNTLRQNKQEHLDHTNEALKVTKKLLSDEEKELFNLDKQLQKSKENLKTASTQQQLNAAEKEIETLEPRKNEHEIVILDLMEKIEYLEDEIDMTKNFLAGSNDTLKEISNEVMEIVSEKRKEISISEEEINLILKSIPSIERELFEMTNKRYRFNTPLVRINNNSCPKCGSSIDRMTLTNVDKAISLEVCPGCNRILLPYS